MTVQAFTRLDERERSAGFDGLADLQRTGRPSKCELTVTEADYLRSLYLKSNLRTGSGSMTLAARMAAKDPASPLLPSTRRAILDVNHKHALPQEIKRALRLGSAVFNRYRDPKAGQNDGIYTPGWLRMAEKPAVISTVAAALGTSSPDAPASRPGQPCSR